MKTNFKAIRAIRLILIVATLFTAGCSEKWKAPKMFSLDDTWPFRDKDQPEQGIPVRMVGTWADTVLTQAGQPAQRGFGGRILFYDKEGQKPILVDGQLVVYAFDEAGRDPTDNKPTRRYVFPAEQLSMRMSKSDLGASYSFWLPWDEAGGPRTEVCLICRFEPKGGAVVTSEQTRHLLPGTAPAAGATAGAKKPPKVPEGVPSKPPHETLESRQSDRNERRAQLTSYEAPVAAGPQGAVVNASHEAAVLPERRMTATTITLPKSYQLPDAAALNAAALAAGYSQTPAQGPRQYYLNGAQPQQPVAAPQGYVPAMPAAPAQAGAMQTYTNQPMQQPLPASSAAQMYPAAQPMMGAQPNMNVGPAAPQAFQQPLVQHFQQQQALRQSPPALQPWPQMQNQAVPTTAVNYPAAAQYPR